MFTKFRNFYRRVIATFLVRCLPADKPLQILRVVKLKRHVERLKNSGNLSKEERAKLFAKTEEEIYNEPL